MCFTLCRPAFALIAFSIVLISVSCSSQEKKATTQSAPPAAAESSDEKTPAASARLEPSSPGEAGGTLEESFTVSATVSAVDPTTRRVTLTAADGRQATFIAGPEIRNFDQLRAGDKVNATLTERLVVFVRGAGDGNGDGAPPSATHAKALAAAPKGAKPGALIAESFEVVAAVQAIDSVNRTATLRFVDGQSVTIPVRADVELSRYKVGDSVVIRVTHALAVLVESP